MGTRSLTRVHAYDGETIARLVNIYRQFDGYPEGHGVDLAEFLQDRTVGNGIPGGQLENAKFSNGPHDLAAQLVCHLKTDNPVGGIYLYSPDARDCWEEYLYDIFVSYKDVFVRVYETWGGDKEDILIFQGGVDSFFEWVNSPEQNEDGEYIPRIEEVPQTES